VKKLDSVLFREHKQKGVNFHVINSCSSAEAKETAAYTCCWSNTA